IDVDAIEVLKSGGNTAIYGIRGGGGVLIITTKRGERNLNYNRYATGIANHNPKGYYKVREFYSPNYGSPKEQPILKDLRTTIYWNPNIITDSLGKATVEFYNADGTGNYRAIIEGLNADGKLGRYIYKYTVE
ncbi:MAG: TonB-dependent receptor, partial [Daejeonella sp.]|nr:TonB-dependent receptor [Daejeonella sp.]